jgi:NADH:ubiquinone oxidoreductase subunit 5 (subunit L)/multisubunit Na+/H+ antiporter MnhA subunit
MQSAGITLETLLIILVALPGAAFAALALAWCIGWNFTEKLISRITSVAFGAASLAALSLAATMLVQGRQTVEVSLGPWFAVHDYEFPLKLLADRLSVPMLLLTTLLVGLVGAFSRRYLHRERGYERFFILLNLFGFGSLLVFAAGSYDLIIAGWELVGITSVLLIAFFQERPDPVRNAIRVFAIYRGSDIGLLVGVFALHHYIGSATYSTLFMGDWPTQLSEALSPSESVVVGLLFLLAAAGKAAQVPFTGWLPRAMEGPTPSSAIFYGAISVHAGAYLLLRSEPLILSSPLISAAVIAVGLFTAVIGTLGSRVSADAKTALAQASAAQLGLIFIEIGLGWTWLALLHIVGHAVVRTLEFLRTPSMLHDYHRMHSAAGGKLDPAGLYYEAALPVGIRAWLYRLSLDRGRMDVVLDRFVVGPVVEMARGLRWAERLVGTHQPGPPSRPRLADLVEDPSPVVVSGGRSDG